MKNNKIIITITLILTALFISTSISPALASESIPTYQESVNTQPSAYEPVQPAIPPCIQLVGQAAILIVNELKVKLWNFFSDLDLQDIVTFFYGVPDDVYDLIYALSVGSDFIINMFVHAMEVLGYYAQDIVDLWNQITDSYFYEQILVPVVSSLVSTAISLFTMFLDNNYNGSLLLFIGAIVSGAITLGTILWNAIIIPLAGLLIPIIVDIFEDLIIPGIGLLLDAFCAILSALLDDDVCPDEVEMEATIITSPTSSLSPSTTPSATSPTSSTTSPTPTSVSPTTTTVKTTSTAPGSTTTRVR